MHLEGGETKLAWQEVLAARLAETRDDEWETRYALVPGPHGVYRRIEQFRAKSFELQIGYGLAPHQLLCLQGLVNSREVAGVAPGCLLLDSFFRRNGGPPFVRFTVRSRPWNHALTPDGTWRPAFDPKGRPPYEAADFSAIP